EKSFSQFPGDFSQLPTVSFVIPNLNDDMHNGTVQQADTWLQTNLDGYAQWAKTHNSLLIVVWDEGDQTDHIPAILYGANITSGTVDNTSYNHYSLLNTILAAEGLSAPNNAANATPIQAFNTTTATPMPTTSTSPPTGPVT